MREIPKVTNPTDVLADTSDLPRAVVPPDALRHRDRLAASRRARIKRRTAKRILERKDAKVRAEGLIPKAKPSVID
jgi:hypothetical protein